MSLEEFMEKYDGAPYSEEDFAIAAADVEDCPELKQSALDYMAAMDSFASTLDRIGVEIG